MKYGLGERKGTLQSYLRISLRIQKNPLNEFNALQSHIPPLDFYMNS